MSTAWIAQQLLQQAGRRRGGLPVELPRYNPRPAGVIREGSATAAVLMVLQQRRLFLSHHQIVAATGRSGKAVDWALLYLRQLGLVEVVPDASRNSRYLRYRAVLRK